MFKLYSQDHIYPPKNIKNSQPSNEDFHLVNAHESLVNKGLGLEFS